MNRLSNLALFCLLLLLSSSISAQMVSVKDHGVKGDGSTDDTAAIQALVDNYTQLYFPPGNYIISDEIVLSSNSQLIGSGVPREIYPSVPATQWNQNSHSFFTYVRTNASDGTEIEPDGDRAAIRVSAYQVGTPPNGTQIDASNTGLQSIGVDCSNICEIGVYFVRPTGIFKNVHVKGSTKHAFAFFNIGGVTFEDLHAYRNFGAGFTLGRNIYGWSQPAIFVDESVFIRPLALFNGETTYFQEQTGQANGYGIGVFASRGLTFIGYESSLNKGPGVWYENSGGGSVNFVGGYSETNCAAPENPVDPKKCWGLWYNGLSDNLNQRNLNFDNIQFRDSIRLTGRQPNRVSAGPVFSGMGYLPKIDADWDRYSLINSNETIEFTNKLPHASLAHTGISEAYGIIGVGQFRMVKNPITNQYEMDGEKHSGIIDSVVRTKEGQYKVTFKSDITMSPENYSVSLTTGSNRTLGLWVKNSNNFFFENRGPNSVLTDSNALINYQVIKFSND